MRNLGWVTVLVLCLVTGMTSAASADWPERAITIVVPIAPGGGTDLNVRSVQPFLSEYLGVDVVVVNMPGADGAIGTRYALEQNPPDGYTVLAVTHTHQAFPATGVSTFTPSDVRMIGKMTTGTAAFSVAVDSPIKTMDDLLERLRAGDVVASVAEIGGAWYMGLAVVANQVGGSFIAVPQGGGYPAAVAAMTGQVDVGMSDISEAMGLAQDGQLRILAYMGTEPWHIPGYGTVEPITNWFPDLADILPAIKGWRGLAYHKDVPEERLQKMIEALQWAMDQPAVQQLNQERGWQRGNSFGSVADEEFAMATRIWSWMMYDLGVAQQSPEKAGIPRP